MLLLFVMNIYNVKNCRNNVFVSNTHCDQSKFDDL